MSILGEGGGGDCTPKLNSTGEYIILHPKVSNIFV